VTVNSTAWPAFRSNTSPVAVAVRRGQPVAAQQQRVRNPRWRGSRRTRPRP